MSTVERYARVSNVIGDTEGTVGLELRDSDDIDFLNEGVFNVLTSALICRRGHKAIVDRVEGWIRTAFPGRAYFIETERDGKGVQVYQPFGMPRFTSPGINVNQQFTVP